MNSDMNVSIYGHVIMPECKNPSNVSGKRKKISMK